MGGCSEEGRLSKLFQTESVTEIFEYLLENASDAIYVLDLKGKFVAVNRKAEELTGFKREDFVGKSFREIISPRDLPKAFKGFLSVARGKSIRLELGLKTAGGKVVPVEVTSTPLVVKGKIVGTFGIVRDISERVLMEKRLQAVNRRLETVLETAMEGITIVDAEENFSFVNHAFAEMLGYKENELIGMNIRKLADDEAFRELRKQTELRRQGKATRYELVLRRKNGEPRYFQVSASPLWNDDGSFAGSIGIALDVTEQKLAEKKILESQQKFKALFSGNPEATVYVDSGFRVLDVNPRFEELFGFSLDEIKGKYINDVLVPKNLKDEARALDKKAGMGYVYYDTVRRRKDGSLVPVLISAAPIVAEGRLIGYVGVYKDVTELKQMMEELRESEEKFRNIFEGANDAIVYGDSTGRILGINRKCEEVAGVKREEIVGKHFWKLGFVSPKDVPKIISRLKSRMMGKPAGGFELVIKSKDGKRRFLEVNVSTLRRGGLPAGFLAIVRDVTERKQMMTKLEEYSQMLEVLVEKRTKQLKEAQEQLLKAERLAAIGQVAAMVGHDLRNPLTGIAGAAYYLKTKLGSKMDKKSKEMVELIEKDIEYANNIISDLLDYSREVRLEVNVANPKLLLDKALSILKIPSNIKVTIDTQDEPTLKVDVEKIKRVFVNIIKNAVDAMPNGGNLTIKSKRKNGNVEIILTDTGMGMSKDVLEKIWTPFFTTKAKGMGLGLPICKRIIEAHGGNISVESVVGKGTKFTVTIPLEPPQSRDEGGEKTWVTPRESWLSMTTKA
ncbi:MAG: PAS domain S-box protein [Candidatus Bathyarchaeia archaeon]